MAEIRKIQCPSCGSNSTYKLFDGNYKCNYCQSNFMVNEGQQQRPAASNRAPVSVPAANAKKIVLLAAGVFVVMVMGMAGFYLTKTQTSADFPEETMVPALQKQPEIKMTKAFVGSEGSVVWIIYEQSRPGDSLYYELLAVDPQTNSVKGKQIIVPLFKSNGSFNLIQKLGYRFWQYDNLAYCISDDDGFVAYNIYTGKKEVSTALLTEKFPELRSGILKTEQDPSGNIFNVTTTTGDVFKFDPRSQTLITPPNPEKRKEEPVTSELYLSDGLKHNLYLFTKRGSGFPIVFSSFVQESRLPKPGGSKTNNVKDIFGNIHIERVSEKNYFRAQPLLKDTDRNLLVLYKTDLSEKSPVILESVNTEGKTNWSLKDTSFLTIAKAISTEDLGCEYTFSGNTLIINLFKDGYQYIAIDIKTGKVLWRFNPKTYLQEKAS